MLNYFKRIGISSSLYFLGDFLIMGLGVILIPFYTRYLAPSDYGVINYLLAVSSFLLPFVSLSVLSTISLKYFDFLKNPERFKVFFSTLFYFAGFFGFIFLATFLLLEYTFHIFTSEQILFYPLFFLSIITCFFTQFVQIPIRVFNCQEKAAKYSYFNFVNFIIGVGLLFFFIAYLKRGVLGNVQALLIRDVIMTIISLLIVKKYLVFDFSFDSLKKALYLALPLIPHSFSVTALTLLDRVFLAHLDTMRIVGLYSLSYQVSNILPIIGGALGTSIYPIFFQLHKKEENHKTATKISSRMITMAIYSLTFIALFLVVFSKEIIYLLAESQYHSTYRIISVLTLGGFFYSLYIIAGIQVAYLKKTYILLICSLSSAVLNLILNILLIPRFSQVGAAIATTVSYFLMFVVAYYFTNKFMPLPLDKKRILATFCLGLLLALISIFTIDSSPVSIAPFFAKIVLIAIFPLLLIKLKFIDLSEVMILLKEKFKK